MDLVGQRRKAYFVEFDDDDRERVMSCIVEFGEVETKFEQDSILSWEDYRSNSIGNGQVTAIIKLKIVANADGTLYTIENFAEQEEEDDA